MEIAKEHVLIGIVVLIVFGYLLSLPYSFYTEIGMFFLGITTGALIWVIYENNN